VPDATLDTAGFGNPESGRHAPTAAVVDGGWLHGRGSADSKAGLALFAHLLRELTQQRQDFAAASAYGSTWTSTAAASAARVPSSSSRSTAADKRAALDRSAPVYRIHRAALRRLQQP
jgi:hypothetical protein